MSGCLSRLIASLIAVLAIIGIIVAIIYLAPIGAAFPGVRE